MDLPVLTVLANEAAGGELPIPAPWFGIIFFVILMSALLITMSFSNKGKELPAEVHTEQ